MLREARGAVLPRGREVDMSRYLSRSPSSRRRCAQWGLTALLAVTMAAAPGASAAETVSGWTEPEPVTAFPAQPDEGFPRAEVAVGPNGQASAVWLAPRAAGGYRVRAAMRDEAGTWTSTGPLSKRVREFVTLGVAVDADGRTSVVWERWPDAAPRVEFVRCDGSGCGAPEAVGIGRAARSRSTGQALPSSPGSAPGRWWCASAPQTVSGARHGPTPHRRCGGTTWP